MAFFLKGLPLRTAPGPVGPTGGSSFRGGRQPRPHDVFIAVMGVTGSGKSSFIAKCSGQSVRIGHSLEGCTSTVDVYAYDMSPGRTVYLIDTPGFDDTSKNDTDVLREIAGWLGASYRSKILLSGIIYLHRVTDIRMQGSAMRNLLMFKQLCGQDALKKVVLVTTMWDRVQSQEEGSRRERELKETPEFWGRMLHHGSSCYRHHNTTESARAIVHRLADHDVPVALDLQRQLVDEQRTLDQTSAGQELQSELLKEKAKWAKERAEIEKHMKDAIKQKDREAEKLMREERDNYTRMIKKVEKDTGALRSTMENLLAERDVRLTNMEKDMKRQQAAHEEELKRIRDRQQRLEREKFEAEKAKERAENARRELERRAQQQRNTTVAPAVQRNTTLAPAVTASPNSSLSPSFRSPYSMALHGTGYICAKPTSVISNESYPEIRKGSARLSFIAGSGSSWIARYTDNTWSQSRDIDTEYPHLGKTIASYGLGNLSYCSLGRGQVCYALWKDGRDTWNAGADARAALSKATSNGFAVASVSFGYGSSWIVSYGHKSRSYRDGGWGHDQDLKGYYRSLARFMKDNPGMNILGIALNEKNDTDFILLWSPKNGGEPRMRWKMESDRTTEAIRKWFLDP